MTLRLEDGQRVDRYLVDGKLGEGGMAVVFRVRHETLGTAHALKIVSLTSRDIRERLVREGKVQANLRHDNIVAVTDVIVVGDEPGLVMEFVEGPTLEAWLLRYSPTIEEAKAVFRAITSGIGYAHTRGLIHRDLKPANILLAFTHDKLIPKITDFGLAKDRSREHATRTLSGSPMGTPAYMAPEQIRDASAVDWRADLWSLGCILYRLTCGVGPFDDDDLMKVFRKASEADYVSSRTLRPDLDETLHAAIEGLLEVDPDKRIADAGALMQYLDGTLAQRPQGGGSPAPTLPQTELARWLSIDSEAARVARQITSEALSHLSSVERAPPPTAWTPAPVSTLKQRSSPQTALYRPGWMVFTGALAMVGGTTTLLILASLVTVAFFTWQQLDRSKRAGDAIVSTSAPIAPAPIVAPEVPAIEALDIPQAPPAQPPVQEAHPPAQLHPEPRVVLVSEPLPEEPPEVVPQPVPSPAKLGAVSATGADRVTLLGADNVEITDLSRVPAGHYRVLATFHGGPPVSAGEINVSDGQRVVLRCEFTFKQCRPGS